MRSPAQLPSDGGSLILAIESATPRGSVALLAGEIVLAETLLPEGRQVSETLLAAVAALLGDAPGLPPAMGAVPRRERSGIKSVPACVAVSAGPGSFTGLRVGMAAAKGFCVGWGVPLVPVPTLHALALRFPVDGAAICPVLDAKKKEVYTAVFRCEGGECVRIAPDRAVAPEALPGLLPPGRIFFCGDGILPYGALLRERFGERALFPPRGEAFPRASAVGLLAARLVREGRVADPRHAVPAYLRPSEAEVKRALRGKPPASRGARSPRGRELTTGRPLIDLENIPNPEVGMGQSMEAKIAALAEKDPAFKVLVQEHRTLDEKLKEFDRKVYLSPDEEMERKRLAKLKLAKKDRIVQILAAQ